MGYVTYTAKGNSDTRIGAPVHRKAAFVGKVDTITNGNEIKVQGTNPSWTADEFTDPTVSQAARICRGNSDGTCPWRIRVLAASDN